MTNVELAKIVAFSILERKNEMNLQTNKES
jgi:hypothetical protein